MQTKRLPRTVKVGRVTLGGGNRIAVQSMCDIPTHDVAEVIKQINELESAGCDIVRLTVNTFEAAEGFKAVRDMTDMPLVADIHFDYRLALAAIEAGADKIRINPGNIGDDAKVKAVADACRAKNIPIRIGVNGGSLSKHILAKYGRVCAEALRDSALEHAALLEKYDFNDIVLSVKSSDVATCVAANRLIAQSCDYPLHIGVTEAGAIPDGLIKNSIGIGALLLDGIGDTVRVSLTDPPVQEVIAANDILKAIGLRHGINIVSCPTCGRTKIDLKRLYAELKDATRDIQTEKDITVALMGCVVNGPGEAREADVGVAGGKGEAVLFKHGEIVGKINECDIVGTLVSEIKELL